MQSAQSAAYRQTASSPASTPAHRDDPFEEGLRQIAKRLRTSIAQLTEREREFLHDLARAEARYCMPTVRKIAALSRRSRRVDDREAFATLILAESTPDVESDVEKAFETEAPCTGAADVQQRAFELHPTVITAARCRAALERQLATTREALGAVREWQRRNA